MEFFYPLCGYLTAQGLQELDAWQPASGRERTGLRYRYDGLRRRQKLLQWFGHVLEVLATDGLCRQGDGPSLGRLDSN